MFFFNSSSRLLVHVSWSLVSQRGLNCSLTKFEAIIANVFLPLEEEYWYSCSFFTIQELDRNGVLSFYVSKRSIGKMRFEILFINLKWDNIFAGLRGLSKQRFKSHIE